MRTYEANAQKISWQGTLQSIQPRTRVWRYLIDNRTHDHLGYNLFIHGENDEGKTDFCVAVSESQLFKGAFQIGDVIQGTAWIKQYPEREFADYYRAGALKVLQKASLPLESIRPWVGQPPVLSVYEERGARMLSQSLWQGKCFTCYWAAMANVEIQWDFDRNIKKYRFEAFCYGPKSCKNYKMGRPRTVPYKNRPSAQDNGWMDDLCTENRADDE